MATLHLGESDGAPVITIFPTNSVNLYNNYYLNLSYLMKKRSTDNITQELFNSLCEMSKIIIFDPSGFYISTDITLGVNLTNAEVFISTSSCHGNGKLKISNFTAPNLKYMYITDTFLSGIQSDTSKQHTLTQFCLPELLMIAGKIPAVSYEESGMNNSNHIEDTDGAILGGCSYCTTMKLPKLHHCLKKSLVIANQCVNLKYLNLSSYIGCYDSSTDTFGNFNQYVVAECPGLECMIIGDIKNINYPLVYNAKNCNFNTLVLNVTTIPNLSNSNNLMSSKQYFPHFTSGGDGSIYVPDSLVNDFKIATNWSVWAEFIKPMSQFVNTWES